LDLSRREEDKGEEARFKLVDARGRFTTLHPNLFSWLGPQGTLARMKSSLWSIPTCVLGGLPPEMAHRAAINAFRLYRVGPESEGDPRLRIEVFGLAFPNPLGLAAGYDKNAEAVDALGAIGFGFVEVGTLTPRPQTGNPKPRLFRLCADRAIINRMGFNNDGYAAASERLRKARRRGIVGVNIGPNKDSLDRIADYALGVETFSALADYFTINISSPNTPGLRDLHARDDFARLVDAVLHARDNARSRRPILVKISPDAPEAQLDDLISIALDRRLDGLIVSNTSVARPPGLQSDRAQQAGGLSGRPIYAGSTRLLARCFLRCNGALPIIGVGGIEDAAGALAKIEAGATLLQIYTGFIYGGPRTIDEILRGLGTEIEGRNLLSIHPLIGSRAQELASS
jgi:dihydroorotate dehydrogenase